MRAVASMRQPPFLLLNEALGSPWRKSVQIQVYTGLATDTGPSGCHPDSERVVGDPKTDPPSKPLSAAGSLIGQMRSILLLAGCSCLAAQTAPPPRSPEYDALQHRLARGWNTWDVHSVAAQVLLPEGFTIRV